LASIENLIVSKIIEEQTLVEPLRSGIKPIHFAGDWEDTYQWVVEYNTKHGAVPSERAFKGRFGHIDLDDASAESFSGLFEELLTAYRLRTVAGAVTDAMGSLNSKDVDAAMSVLSKGLQSASADTTKLRDFNIIEGWEARLAQYEEMRKDTNALRGIPTGFVGLDRLTHGFRPQQWIVMAGEQKRGKSLFQLIMARACHLTGLTPMLISYEMSVAEQLSRYDALRAKIPYDRILSGDLSDAEMARLYKELRDDKGQHRFIMSEDSSGLTTVGSIAAKLQEYRPAALFVDGIYLMEDENGEQKGSPQALTNISRGMKRLAQKFDIPIIGTTQALSWKLQNKRTRALTTDAMGYTSAFGQDADLILGVERNPDVDDQAIIRILDARTAPRAEIHVQWDFRTMEFEEVDESEYDTSFD
jgi:replicative DNA helicase